MEKSAPGTVCQQPCSRSCMALDQVWYAKFAQAGECWRMGSVDPGWEQKLPLTSQPAETYLTRLAEQGIWLAKDNGKTPDLAVMCCGQGSIWPGMGRELYDCFPEARAAMDRLAACTNWDVLGLMDEPDVEVIGLTQWAQPYLFFIEYAQMSLLKARGLKPAIYCGHSLGELIALCLSGVYSPETCWYILETRSRHVAEMEARSRRDSGMMGVYGGIEEVQELLTQWPDLRVANYNTAQQIILSGPKEALVEARRALRKRRIPAVILNIALAFHHPSMRVLRDLDYQLLMTLEMRAATTPMLSCVTSKDYPVEQKNICAAIMDLDENSVNWVKTVNTLWDERQARHFLELGPQDTLCGLVSTIRPEALCLSASSRGRERDCMRQTLARLYALGHLEHGTITQVAKDWQPLPEVPARPPLKEVRAEAAEGAEKETVGIAPLRELLAKACGRPVADLRGSMDLRFDLHLRSSFFPSLIEDAQKALGVEVPFEELLNVSTIADLERVFSPDRNLNADGAGHAVLGADVERPFLARCSAEEKDAGRELAQHPARALSAVSSVAVLGTNDELCADLVRGLASLGARFSLAKEMPTTQAAVLAMGGSLEEGSWQVLPAGGSRFDVVLCQGICSFDEDTRKRVLSVKCTTMIFVEEDSADTRASLRCLVEEAGTEPCRALGVLMSSDTVPCYAVTTPPAGDLLLRELREANQGLVLWQSDEKARLVSQPMVDDADASPLVFPEKRELLSRRTACSSWNAQFSPEVFPLIKDAPGDDEGWRKLPLPLLLEAQRQAAVLASPGLAAVSVCDIRRLGGGDVREGLVREVSMYADLQPWLPHEGVMVRHARVRSQLRGMNRKGRSSFQYDSLLEANVFLAGRRPELVPLWPPADRGTADAWAGQTVAMETWYEERRVGPRGRFLVNVRVEPEHVLRAELTDMTFLALQGIWPYNASINAAAYGSRHICALGAILQACEVARSVDVPRTLCEAEPGLIGFVRFGEAAADGPFALHLRRSWDNDRVLRYDAQVTDRDGRCLIAVNHIEFNALPEAGASS